MQAYRELLCFCFCKHWLLANYLNLTRFIHYIQYWFLHKHGHCSKILQHSCHWCCNAIVSNLHSQNGDTHVRLHLPMITLWWLMSFVEWRGFTRVWPENCKLNFTVKVRRTQNSKCSVKQEFNRCGVTEDNMNNCRYLYTYLSVMLQHTCMLVTTSYRCGHVIACDLYTGTLHRGEG